MDKKKIIILVAGVVIFLGGIMTLFGGHSSKFSAPTPYFPEKNESAGTFTDLAKQSPTVTPSPTPTATPTPEGNTKIQAPYQIEPVEPQTVPEEEIKEEEENQGEESTEINIEPQKDRENKALDAIREAKIVTDEQLVLFLYGEEFIKKGGEMPPRSKLLEELMSRLNSSDEYEANEAAIALDKSVNEIDAQGIAEAIQTGGYTDFAETTIVRILGKLKDRRVFKTLYDEFKRVNNQQIRDAIILALGDLGDDRAISVLLSVINATTKDVRHFYSSDSRAFALASLVKIGTPRAKGAFESGVDEMVSSDVWKHISYAKARLNNEIDPSRVDTVVVPGQAEQELVYKGTRYLLYVPTKRKNDFTRTRVFVCIHDENINVEDLFSDCRDVARKYKFAVLAPIFEAADYPYYGTLNITGQRADIRLWDILKHLSQYAALDIREIFLFGMGRGGLFVQSFTMAYPDRVGRALFDSETMIKPNMREVFPKGIGATPWAPEIKVDLVKYIKSDIVLLSAKGQGRHRPSSKTLKEYLKIADDKGITPRIGSRQYKPGATGDTRLSQNEVMESYLFEGL